MALVSSLGELTHDGVKLTFGCSPPGLPPWAGADAANHFLLASTPPPRAVHRVKGHQHTRLVFIDRLARCSSRMR